MCNLLLLSLPLLLLLLLPMVIHYVNVGGGGGGVWVIQVKCLTIHRPTDRLREWIIQLCTAQEQTVNCGDLTIYCCCCCCCMVCMFYTFMLPECKIKPMSTRGTITNAHKIKRQTRNEKEVLCNTYIHMLDTDIVIVWIELCVHIRICWKKQGRKKKVFFQIIRRYCRFFINTHPMFCSFAIMRRPPKIDHGWVILSSSRNEALLAKLVDKIFQISG